MKFFFCVSFLSSLLFLLRVEIDTRPPGGIVVGTQESKGTF